MNNDWQVSTGGTILNHGETKQWKILGNNEQVSLDGLEIWRQSGAKPRQRETCSSRRQPKMARILPVEQRCCEHRKECGAKVAHDNKYWLASKYPKHNDKWTVRYDISVTKTCVTCFGLWGPSSGIPLHSRQSAGLSLRLYRHILLPKMLKCRTKHRSTTTMFNTLLDSAVPTNAGQGTWLSRRGIRTQLSSGMLRCVVWQMVTDVSEVFYCLYQVRENTYKQQPAMSVQDPMKMARQERNLGVLLVIQSLVNKISCLIVHLGLRVLGFES